MTEPHSGNTESKVVVLGEDSLVSSPGDSGVPCSALGGHRAAVDLCVPVVASEALCITDTR